jgi:hypothetical protein
MRCGLCGKSCSCPPSQRLPQLDWLRAALDEVDNLGLLLFCLALIVVGALLAFGVMCLIWRMMP